jgi:hypothetical protein
MSPVGTKRTNCAGLAMSVVRGTPEVAGGSAGRRFGRQLASAGTARLEAPTPGCRD